MTAFLLSSFLLFVGSLAYLKLREQLKKLNDELADHHSAYKKIQESNTDLKSELQRIEKRIDQIGQIDPEIPPAADTEDKTIPSQDQPHFEAKAVKAKEKSGKPLSFTPPPLPQNLEHSKAKKTSASPVVAETPNTHSTKASENKSTTPPPRPAPTEPSFFERIPWRAILERLHLWPPSKSEAGENAEIQLAAWWTARIGLIFLIIAAVFFGVYVSQHTPPILRVAALLLVSVGTIALGARMKDKLQGFGRAIIGGGFALLYFTAFAAFALPPTKIIDSPTIGILAQLAALIAAISWSLWKKDQTVASLTLLLGFISCTFSHSNDLDHFTLIGLVLLAATGAFLFARRGWLTAFITSLVSSWVGYALFALLDWQHADAPSFLTITATLVTLTVLFEVGNLVSIARCIHPLSDRWRRWLILSNTSAAAVLGYSVTRLVYPDQLSTFYFIFALLYFAFTLIHYFRSTDEALTETLFLKSSALLCLGFASAFDGPVRWLAIAFQSFALLWTARRSGSRWIALGFALVFSASIAWFWHDLAISPPEKWLWFESFRLAGAFYLIFLTAQLALHSKWFPSGIGGLNDEHQKQAHQARLLGAGVIGVSSIMLALVPSTNDLSQPLWFLLLLSAATTLITPLMRRALPCLAAAIPALATYVLYATLSYPTNRSTSALLLGFTLIALAFAIAELIRRFWPSEIKGSDTGRGFILLIGLISLIPFTYALRQSLSISNNTAIAVFALIPLVTTAALLLRQQNPVEKLKNKSTSFFFIFSGSIVLIGGLATCSGSKYFPSALLIASLPLLASLFKTPVRKVALSGLIPLLGAFLFLWRSLLNTRPGHLHLDSINLAIALIAVISIAVISWKKLKSPELQKLGFYVDTLLHGLAILSLHLFFQKHLSEGPDLFAGSLLGLTLFIISRRFPFRILAALSWLPITFALFSGLLNDNWQGVTNGQIWFWATALISLIHLLLFTRWTQKDNQADSAFVTDTLWIRFSPLASSITLGSWMMVILAAAASPWQAAGLSGIALLYSALWRWKKIESLGPLALIPLALAALMSASLMLNPGHLQTQQILASILLTSIAFAINGMLLASAQRHLLQQKISASSLLPWLHAGLALLIAFTVCSMDNLVSEKLTIVFWGISVIALFISGLFAGLRAYRLTALIGLALFCIPHIVIWDVQDTLYRIIASLAIASVLLAIAFLYNKFRDRITSLDA